MACIAVHAGIDIAGDISVLGCHLGLVVGVAVDTGEFPEIGGEMAFRAIDLAVFA